MQPLSYIPEPVKQALTQQYPELVIALVVIMTVILLPQGIFTIYWMTYTWVHPKRFEKSGAPKQYEVPRYSFTALLPARKEEAVIYDTIMSVHNIDYPEHLKETLILVRDEDDDGTIERTMAAIADIKEEYEKRGEAYPDNVHLITFTDGPKNKPNGLNRGYRESTKEVICIFDAEDQPHEQIYNAVNTKMMNDGADVVQSGVQLMNFKSNWFSALNSYFKFLDYDGYIQGNPLLECRDRYLDFSRDGTGSERQLISVQEMSILVHGTLNVRNRAIIPHAGKDRRVAQRARRDRPGPHRLGGAVDPAS